MKYNSVYWAYNKFLFTRESRNEGNSSKICDAISDSIVDDCFRDNTNSYVPCETAIKNDTVFIFEEEVTTYSKINYKKTVCATIRNIGNGSPDKGLDYKIFKIMIGIDKQSPNIAQSVHENKNIEDIAAGDQGIVFGYATDETKVLMPLYYILDTKIGLHIFATIYSCKSFKEAVKPLLKLTCNILKGELIKKENLIYKNIIKIWLYTLFQFFNLDSIITEIKKMIPYFTIIQHIRYLLTSLLNIIILGFNSNVTFKNLCIEIILASLNLIYSKDTITNNKVNVLRNKEQANCCLCLMRLYNIKGSYYHELSLLSALASFVFSPNYKSFLNIKKLHKKTVNKDNVFVSQHKIEMDLIFNRSSVCEENELNCLHDQDLNWNKLVNSLLNTNISVKNAVRICLEEMKYDKAVHLVSPFINYILPPEFYDPNGIKLSQLAYNCMQYMLSNCTFVSNYPNFCYFSSRKLVYNIIKYGSGEFLHDSNAIIQKNNKNINGTKEKTLSLEHFNLIYEAVKVMCFVVKDLENYQIALSKCSKVQTIDKNEHSDINFYTLYEDLYIIMSIPGLPTNNVRLKLLWKEIAEIIQNSLGSKTTEKLLNQKLIL